MTKLSISDAGRWTGDFLRREWQLVLPIAAAFMALPRLALQLLVPGARTMGAEEMARAQPWMIWLIPVLALYFIGVLAVTALALVPRISVGEALVAAATRLWVLVVAWIALGIGIMLLLAVLAFGGALLGVSTTTLTGFGVLLCFVALLAAAARLLPIFAVVAVEHPAPVMAIRRAAALTRGHAGRLFGALLLLAVAGGIVTFAIAQVLGVVALLVGRATGIEQPLLAVAAIIVALIGAGLSAAFYIFAAAIYRQLRGQA